MYAPGWYPIEWYMPYPSYLYRAYDARGRLLYVGVSDNPDKRFRDGHRLHSRWFMDIASLTITRYPARVAAEVAEDAAIWDECPLWNRDGQWDRDSQLGPERRRAAAASARRHMSEQRTGAQWDKVWVMIFSQMNAVCPEGFTRRNPADARRLPPEFRPLTGARRP